MGAPAEQRVSGHFDPRTREPRSAIHSPAASAAQAHARPVQGSDKFTHERILEVRPWTPHLFSFKTTRYRGFRFVPGQFARLGLPKEDGSIVWRAYSIVSASYDEHLEFYSVVVPRGEFTSRLNQLGVGDEIYVEKMSYGFLTTARFEGGRDLWMLSTGTGLAPFISILYDLEPWERYDNLILVHGVRSAPELAYADLIRTFATDELFSDYAHKLKYVQAVTRENVRGALTGRITSLLEDGRLEREVGLALDHERSRIMVCGNPEMVDDTRKLLVDRGFAVSRRAKPGHLALENLW
jgi:ferredoxin/flavodoxin---NADP+ reductase